MELTNEDGKKYLYDTKLVEVTFAARHDSVPQISVAQQDRWFLSEYQGGLRLDPVEVTREGFKLRCALEKSRYKKHHGRQQIKDLRVRWTSLPQ